MLEAWSEHSMPPLTRSSSLLSSLLFPSLLSLYVKTSSFPLQAEFFHVAGNSGKTLPFDRHRPRAVVVLGFLRQ